MKKLSSVAIAALSLTTAVALVGCGGNGTNPSVEDVVLASGNVNERTVSAPVDIPASDDYQTITVDGVEVDVPPTDEPIAAGDPVVVFDVDTSIINNLEDDPDAQVRAVSAYVWKDGGKKVFKAGLLNNGKLVKPLALGKGRWHIQTVPCFIYSGNKANRLSIKNITINFVVNAQGKSSFPSISGTFPQNGQSLLKKYFVNVLVDKAFAGANASLSISSPTQTISKSMTYSVSGPKARTTFQDLVNAGTFNVPATGLTDITFNSAY